MNINEEPIKTRNDLESAVQHHVKSDDTNVHYYGWAIPGTLTSVARWRIMRMTYSSDDWIVTWADSNTLYDNEYDNRETLTYG